MRRIFLGLGAAVLTLAVAGSARADDHRHSYGKYGYGGHSHGKFSGKYYGGSGSYYGGFPGHGHHSSRYPHFDYVPGHFHRHGNHSHYVPPHWDLHHRGRRYEVVPGPFPGSWSTTPWHHHRD